MSAKLFDGSEKRKLTSVGIRASKKSAIGKGLDLELSSYNAAAITNKFCCNYKYNSKYNSMYTQQKQKVINLYFFPNLFKKRNLESILFILIHSL